jgi:branched-subunit amino acid aminotransferase/4-amino-4-deoxychorismate lyase
VSGLFETVRVRRGGIPFLDAHFGRLSRGLEELGLPPPGPGLRDRLLAHAAQGEAVVRLTVDEQGERVETRAVPPETPMRVAVSGTPHQPYPRKSTDREVFEAARDRIVPYRADEALLLTRDRMLAEGCITSVFFFRADTLCTPSLELGILPGVGRWRVLELARGRGIGVEEGAYPEGYWEGLPMFLVNAVRGVIPVRRQGENHPLVDDRISRLAGWFWS